MERRETPGYSGTPLAKKLGLKDGSRVATIAAPEGYARLLEPLPAGVRLTSRPGPDSASSISSLPGAKISRSS